MYLEFISYMLVLSFCIFFFFFNDTATTEIYTLSLHDALPIFRRGRSAARSRWRWTRTRSWPRSSGWSSRRTDRRRAGRGPAHQRWRSRRRQGRGRRVQRPAGGAVAGHVLVAVEAVQRAVDDVLEHAGGAAQVQR